MKTWPGVAGLLSFFLLAGVGNASSQGQVLKVLSINMNAEASLRDSGEKLRRLRFTRYLDWIRKNDPDLIFVTEGYEVFDDPSVAVSLARALDYDVAYRIPVGFVGVTYYSDAIIAKKKFHMMDEQDIELPHSAFSFGDGKKWLGAFGPISFGIGVRLTLDNGEPIYTYATHLLGQTEKERLDQGAALQQAIRKQIVSDGRDWNSTKVIYGGDLNDDASGALERYLVSEGYQGSWEQAHPGDPGYTIYGDPARPMFNPVATSAGLIPLQSDPENVHVVQSDHIFLHGPELKTLASTVVFTSPMDGIWMSDHYGVFSTLIVNGDAQAPAANPLNDLVEMPPATVFEVSEKMFRCGSFIDRKCHLKLGIQKVQGPRGLTIRNLAGTGSIDIDIDDRAGWIYTAPNAHLGDDNTASFIFTKTGDYPYWLTDNFGNTIEGVFRVTGI